MTKKSLDALWDQFRQKYGVYLRVLEAIPADRYHTNPIPGMRTPTELAVHTSGTIVRDIAQGVANGRLVDPDPPEVKVVASLETKDEVIEFARTCWKLADAAVTRIGEAELEATVPTPWNMSFPGSFGFNIINDEFLHHRGQLYAFARACGSTPPFLWSHGENEDGFRPR